MDNDYIAGDATGSFGDSSGSAYARQGINEKIVKLVSLSKQHGFVTIQDINGVIPGSETDPELIENVMNILDGLGVEMFFDEEAASFRGRAETTDLKEVPPAAPQSPFVGPYDSFDVYLEQVNLKPRISRAEELEVFNHVVDAEYRAQEFIFSRWMTLPYHLDMADKILDGSKKFEDIMDGRKVKRNAHSMNILAADVMSGRKLQGELDALWMAYLDESDVEKKARAREEYHRVELDSSSGCKSLLRRLRFRMSLFEAWLDRLEVMDDFGDARRLVDSSIAEAAIGPAPIADAAGKDLKRAREIEERWRLSPLEFVKIVEKTRMHLEEVRRAKAELTENNLRLVIACARHFQGRGLHLIDLIQEGNIGLMKAVDKYDPTRGYHFAAFSSWWIRQAVGRAIANQARMVRIPVHLVGAVDKFVQIRKLLIRKLGREPTIEELACKLNVPVERMPRYLETVRKHALYGDDVSEVETVSSAEDGLSALEELSTAEGPAHLAFAGASIDKLRERLDFALRSLAEREKEVLILRFGLIDGVQRTLEEIGRHFNVTRERIRQIESKALRKMRHPARMRQLLELFEGQVDICEHSFDQFISDDELTPDESDKAGDSLPPGGALEAFMNEERHPDDNDSSKPT